MADTESFPTSGPGRCYRVASVAGTDEGGNATDLIADELHAWTGKRERVFTVLRAGTRKRRRPGRTVCISTAGVAGSKSLLERKYKALAANHDNTTLFVWCTDSGTHDLTTTEGVRAALLEASPNGAMFYDLDQRIKDFFNPGTPRYESERYFLNRWVTADSESWLEDLGPNAFESLGVEGLEIPTDRPVVMGLDLALRHDSIAVASAWKLDDGRPAVTARIWSTTNNERHDLTDVETYIK